MLPTLDETTHTYWLDGREIPSVTGILTAAGLIDMQWVTQFGLDRGSAVHAAIHYDNAGDLDESSLDPAAKPYLEQWRHFKRLTAPKIIGAEQTVFSPMHTFTGRYDLLIEYFGLPMLIDIKTNHAPNWVIKQLGFYAFALREAGVKLQRVGCLELKPDAYSLKTWEPLQAEAEAMRVLAQVKEMSR